MSLLNSSQKLGPYEILNPLGAGGMGEVWKARDSRLNRFVAIKKSHDQFSERFAREAQAIAALNHPYICQLYDVGPDYLVMEYVEGQPLTGPLPVAKAVEYAAQICDALDTAHRKGIIHRDLKPANILLTKSGIKILDFGLARIEQGKSEAASGDSATMSQTAEGTILGTLQYMSPEQVEGHLADARSDIFALGLVLYEMITGKRPFTGATKTGLMASILKDQPQPLRTMVPLTPVPLERIVQTCLEKDPEKRWQSARDLKHALEWTQNEAPSAPVTASPGIPSSTKKSWIWPAIAAVLLIAAAMGAWALWPKNAAPARATRFEVTLPEGVEFSQYVSVSPDGHKLVFNATGVQEGLWIRDLDTLQWRRLQGTEGSSSPFWSPDSKFLGFSVRNVLKKIEVSGGPPQTLCMAPQAVGTGSWSADGVIVFGGKGVGIIRRVSAAGGVPVDVTAVDNTRGESYHGLPMFLPDGKHFVYYQSGTADVRGMYVGSLDVKPAEQSKMRFLATTFTAQFVAGNVFFIREGTLMVQPFDDAKLQLRGEPVPIAEHVGGELAVGYFSVSPAGVLAYRTGTAVVGGVQHTWLDREGKPAGTVGDLRPDTGVAISPDGTRAAGRDASSQIRGDIWLIDFARAVRTQLTFHQSLGSMPVWLPDGNRIIFAAGNAIDTIYEKAASGAGEEKELLKKTGSILYPTDVSRDGRFLLFTEINAPKTGNDIWVLPLQAGGKPSLLLGSEFQESAAVFSPDGRWIAYVSDESGRVEVYVRPFVANGSSGPSLGDGKWRVSRDGAFQPKWRTDKEIIFRFQTTRFAVDVNGSGAAPQIGTPKQLFTAAVDNGWDVTPDGKRFLALLSAAPQNSQTPITVVLNWQADLKH
jgi:serine/threonine protein kinase/Tol biopolymer transport system component